MKIYLQMKSPKLVTKIIQHLAEREADTDVAAQILDGQGF